MKGTALLMNEDMTLTVLENVDVSVYKELKNEKKYDQPHCTINHKEYKCQDNYVHFRLFKNVQFGLIG